MPTIQFFEEDVSYNLKNKLNIRKWVAETITAEGYKLREINYIFCSDDHLLKINQQYLNHDTYTDVITFDNSDGDGIITGDIFISIERIKENAVKFAVKPDQELHRVMIHGALHLAGYKDKSVANKKKMTLKEDFYLAKRGF